MKFFKVRRCLRLRFVAKATMDHERNGRWRRNALTISPPERSWFGMSIIERGRGASLPSKRSERATLYRRGEIAEAEPAVPGWTMAVDDLFRQGEQE